MNTENLALLLKEVRDTGTKNHLQQHTSSASARGIPHHFDPQGPYQRSKLSHPKLSSSIDGFVPLGLEHRVPVKIPLFQCFGKSIRLMG